MIALTRLNGKVFILNSDLIEFLEATPDTVVTLSTGKKLVVTEEVDEIIEKIVKYKKRVFSLEQQFVTSKDEITITKG